MDNSTKSWRVIRNRVSQCFEIINATDVEEIYTHESHDDYGALCGHCDAGDCSLLNPECSLPSQARAEGASLFGDAFADAEFEEIHGDIRIANPEELEGLEDRIDEMNAFCRQYEAEHAVYNRMTGITYWNGCNYITVPVDEEDYVDKEQEQEILQAYAEAEFHPSIAGSEEASCNGYLFQRTSYPSYWVARVNVGIGDAL